MKVYAKSLVPFIALFVSGCQTVEKEALGEDATRQIVSIDHKVLDFGIYRLYYDKNKNIAAYQICGADLDNRSLFGPDRISGDIKRNIYPKKIGTFTDDVATDHITITFSPSAKKEIGDSGFAVAGKVNLGNLAQAKRIVSNYKVSESETNIVDKDETVDKNYIFSNVGKNCRDAINDKNKVKSRGIPVFVYKYVKADKIYTQSAKAPSITGEFYKKSDPEKKAITTIDLYKSSKFDTAEDAVFGYRYFTLGPWTESQIPTLK